MTKRSVLLVIGGGAAAYKSLDLIRLLRREGVGVGCILTGAARRFVTPLSVTALSGNEAHTDLFDAGDEAEIGHIALSRRSDLVVVCPASADLMATLAAGLAPDLAGTVLLATDRPVLMVPAMNVRMWSHPATSRNVGRLRADGVTVLEPDIGRMACGEFGAGRLPEPDIVRDEILAMLDIGTEPATAAPTLAGRRAVVTAGPTRERLDPVRFLSNESSGRQGFAVAAALRALGADVRLVAGPTSIPVPPGLEAIGVETAEEMLRAVEEGLPADIFVGVAAVCDWRPRARSPEKLQWKDSKTTPDLELVETPDILRHVAAPGPRRPRLVVGFAAETGNIAVRAREKLLTKGCDWIVANDVSGKVIGSDRNQVRLLRAGGEEAWPEMRKSELAARLAERIADALAAAEGPAARTRAEGA